MTLAAHAPRRCSPPPLDLVRVTGRLESDASLHRTTGSPPHALLGLHIAPAQGMPYVAQVDLGTDLADQMAAEALLPALRTGATVSVAGAGLRWRADHGHAALQVLQAHSVLVLTNPIAPTTTTASQPEEA